MFLSSKRAPVGHPPGHLRCAWCGSDDTTPRGSSGTHYCHHCARLFRDAPEIPFDVIADQSTPALSALQAAGDVIAVRLPGGFYGVCVLPDADGCPVGRGSRRSRP
jgi:hypothetical protein